MREHFNQSYIRLKTKLPCCQIILLNTYSAQLAIPVFKINFAISTFGNFLRDVQLKWFYFKHHSYTTESVLMTIIFWQTEQNHLELFFLVEKFQTFCPCRIFKIFSDSIKIYKFFIPYEVCMVLRSDFKFSFITSKSCSAFFAVDEETTQAKRMLPFLALFNLMNGTIIFLYCFSWSFLKMEDLSTLHPSVFLFSKKRKLAKKHTFFQEYFQVAICSL